MAEYRLSYTGSEINVKLAKIDNIKNELATEIITQNEGNATDKVMSQAAVTEALKTVTTLPHGGSVEWLEAHGDTEKLYQIDGYVWGHTESEGWIKSNTRFLVVTSTAQMTNVGGTPYILRSGNTGRVYSYHEAAGDTNIPVYGTLPESANEGDIIAVGGRKYQASVTETQVPNFTNVADTSSADWWTNGRVGSDGTIRTQDGYDCTNYIGPLTAGSVVRISGMDFSDTLPQSGCFKADKTLHGDGVTSIKSFGNITDTSFTSTGCQFTNTKSDVVYWKVTGKRIGDGKDVIITINEEITYRTETTVAWTDIGVYTPPVEAGWSATDETYSVIDTLSGTLSNGGSAVYSEDGYLYTYIVGSGWMQMSKYEAPSIAIDGELSDSSTNAIQNKIITGELNEIKNNVRTNTNEIAIIKERVGDIITIPTWWESAVNECISKIKALQIGKNCVTFPFFSDNHSRDGAVQYMGVMIAHIMKECGIPYCFFGGDAISNGYLTEAEMIEQAKAFDEAMSYIPEGRLCRTLGNHDGFWAISSTEKYSYTREQIYEFFLRKDGVLQNRHFGDDGTYYYVDDVASKVRWIVLNTNGIGNTAIDTAQLSWFENTALKFDESGWGVVIISHCPITNHYEQADISNNEEVIEIVQNYMNNSDENGADIIGWFSGHIHRDRIYTGVSVPDTNNDEEVGNMGFKQVTITSDATNIAYEDATRHPIDDSDKSHAIDFVTINKDTRAVHITRLGIGEDRYYQY